jgi:hypothetical protein
MDTPMSRQSYPLSWPEGWKRTAPSARARARFNRKDRQYSTNATTGQQTSWQRTKEVTISDGVQRILRELSAMGISSERAIISTNVEPRLDGLPRSGREPQDPGAAVYWEAQRGKVQRCMAIDMYDRVADNLAAIAATLAAMRAIERHGGATILDRAFLGFAALPEKASQPWREVLGIEGAATLDLVESRFHSLVKVHHPDQGGEKERETFERIVQAREAARMELSA